MYLREGKTNIPVGLRHFPSKICVQRFHLKANRFILGIALQASSQPIDYILYVVWLSAKVKAGDA